MNVLKASIGVIPVQLATTLQGVTPALVTLDTLGVGLLAFVSTFFSHYRFTMVNFFTFVCLFVLFLLLMPTSII